MGQVPAQLMQFFDLCLRGLIRRKGLLHGRQGPTQVHGGHLQPIDVRAPLRGRVALAKVLFNPGGSPIRPLPHLASFLEPELETLPRGDPHRRKGLLVNGPAPVAEQEKPQPGSGHTPGPGTGRDAGLTTTAVAG